MLEIDKSPSISDSLKYTSQTNIEKRHPYEVSIVSYGQPDL